MQQWLKLAYGAGYRRPEPLRAARMLSERPELLDQDAYAGLAAGVVSGEVLAEPDLPGGPLGMPPLIAVTFSSLIRLPEYTDALLTAARRLLDAGADPNQTWIDAAFPEFPLSALYGAAGKNHDPAMTRMLLGAGANPNDGESLYHSVEHHDLSCTRLLLAAGAEVTGTNAMMRALDFDNIEALELLLAFGGDANESPTSAGSSGHPLQWAIRRRRSVEHIRALLEAGADPEGAHVLALRYGLPEVAELLPSDEVLSLEDEFVAACAIVDRAKAQALLDANPGLISRLNGDQLRMLPELAFAGCDDAVVYMVELGWPVAVKGCDWDASALNAAVFRGNATLARFLLEHGASWREEHGYGDNVGGTLVFASSAEPVVGGDWEACAEVLKEFGMPPR